MGISVADVWNKKPNIMLCKAMASFYLYKQSILFIQIMYYYDMH